MLSPPSQVGWVGAGKEAGWESGLVSRHDSGWAPGHAFQKDYLPVGPPATLLGH